MIGHRKVGVTHMSTEPPAKVDHPHEVIVLIITTNGLTRQISQVSRRWLPRLDSNQQPSG